MPRYERKFDWDEAKRLYDEEQIPMTWLAAKYRVSVSGIRRIVKPGERERMAIYQREAAIGKGRCEACGAATNRVAQQHGSRFCKNCANKRMQTSVRETTLQCGVCKQWKPDDQFARTSQAMFAHRRGHRRDCRVCSTLIRKRYRETHRILCKGGCGRLVSPSDQRMSKKQRQSKTLRVGYCPSCSRKKLSKQAKLEISAAKFRAKFGTAADRADTTT